MKVLVSHARGWNFLDELYQPLKESPLLSFCDFIFPHENDEFVDTLACMKDLDVLLVEGSYPSTGSGIEIGYALAHNIKIIVVHKKSSSPSGSLLHISDTVIPYSGVDGLLQSLYGVLQE